MKFDDQLAAYLYENKTLQLEGIGTFTLDNKINPPGQQDREVYYPIEGLSFIYNPKSQTDENIIYFLVQRLHKIEPLIRSDLESYLSNIKQFLNLGKPYTIVGVGTLSKNNHGTYEFTPGNFLPVKEELNPKRENIEHNYPKRSTVSAGRIVLLILIAIAAIAAIGGIGWGVSALISSQTPQYEQVPDIEEEPVADTPVVVNTKPVSAKPANTDTVKPGDPVQYKMVFEITRYKERADKRTTQLNLYRTNSKYDTIRVGDSLRYRLFLPVTIRPVDTLRVRDSLSKFLGRRVSVVKE